MSLLIKSMRLLSLNILQMLSDKQADCLTKHFFWGSLNANNYYVK